MSERQPDAPRGARTAYIALGSNLGDRAAYLAMARARIALLRGTAVLAASRIEETAPLGEVPQGPYLNQMVRVMTTLDAHTLLRELHALERAAGRLRRERWGPRTLDLDIVTIDGESRADDVLVLPHPGLADRAFWQRELAELRSIPMSPRTAEPSVPAPPEPPLPEWAMVSPERRAHIARVTSLLDTWADAMQIDPVERLAWHDAGRLHDVLRDADEPTLRTLVPRADYATPMLHGPAAAVRLAHEGEQRRDVLDAVRYHTVGSAAWARTGQALYMADYLEPGRPFARDERSELATRVPDSFAEVFRAVVRHRIEWALREGKALYPGCIAMWNVHR